jgi:hypothetical protein
MEAIGLDRLTRELAGLGRIMMGSFILRATGKEIAGGLDMIITGTVTMTAISIVTTTTETTTETMTETMTVTVTMVAIMTRIMAANSELFLSTRLCRPGERGKTPAKTALQICNSHVYSDTLLRRQTGPYQSFSHAIFRGDFRI